MRAHSSRSQTASGALFLAAVAAFVVMAQTQGDPLLTGF